jgi:hypothetical protein
MSTSITSQESEFSELVESARGVSPKHQDSHSAAMRLRNELESLAAQMGLSTKDFLDKAENNPQFDERIMRGLTLQRQLQFLKSK